MAVFVEKINSIRLV